MKRFLIPLFVFLSFLVSSGSVFASNNWTYSQPFNSLNVGPLAGQDSWSNVINGSYYTVTTGDPYEGALAVQATSSVQTYQEVQRSISAISSGTFYVSLKGNGPTAGTDYFSFTVLDTSDNPKIWILFRGQNHTIELYNNAGSCGFTTIANYTNNVWYRFGIQFDTATQKFKYNINNGAWSADYNLCFTSTNIDTIDMNFRYGSGNPSIYIDDIGPTFSTALPVCGNGSLEEGEVCDGSTEACTNDFGNPGIRTCNQFCNGYGFCIGTTTAIVHTETLHSDIGDAVKPFFEPFSPYISLVQGYAVTLSIIAIIFLIVYYLIRHYFNVNKVNVNNNVGVIFPRDYRINKSIKNSFQKFDRSRSLSRQYRNNVLEGEIVSQRYLGKSAGRFIGVRNIIHRHRMK